MTAPENTPAPEATPTPAPEAPKATEPAASDWKAPATQAELDQIISKRLERERAKFADYDSLREKASYWDELEDASKTEFDQQAEALQSVVERYEAAQARVVQAELKAAGVPAAIIEDLDLSRFIEDGEVSEDRIVAMREKYAALAPNTPRMAPNPAQGTSAQPPLSVAERIAAAQSAGDTKTVMRLKAAMAVSSNPTH